MRPLSVRALNVVLLTVDVVATDVGLGTVGVPVGCARATGGLGLAAARWGWGGVGGASVGVGGGAAVGVADAATTGGSVGDGADWAACCGGCAPLVDVQSEGLVLQ